MCQKSNAIAPAQGNVASVSTFHACLDVLDLSTPSWAIFENVESIDKEVDPDLCLGRWVSSI